MTQQAKAKTGDVNQHGQIVVRNVREADAQQPIYELACSHCGHVYGTAEAEAAERRCPNCQQGAPGLALNLEIATDRRQKWPTALVIVRHGQSEKNVAKDRAWREGAEDVFAGGVRDADVPLTSFGVEQALATGDFLKDKLTFDVVFSSPYLRTLQTTQHMLTRFAVAPPVILDERIREIEFGILDGLTWHGVRKRYPEEFERRNREGKYWYRPPGGESRPDVALRVHSFLGTLTRDYSRKNVLVVCHSVVVLIFRRLLERWDEAKYMKVDKESDVLNCGVTAYRFDPKSKKLVLDYYNSICYPAAPVERS